MNIPLSDIMTSRHSYWHISLYKWYATSLAVFVLRGIISGEVVNYCKNIFVARGSWLEANHQINGYLAPEFVRHNHTMELGVCLLQVYILHNLAFVARIYEFGHILGDPRPIVPLGNPLTCVILPEMPSS